MKQLLKRLLYAGLPIPGLIRPVIAALYRAGVWCVEGSAFFRKLFWVEPVLRSIATVGTGLRAECLPYIRGNGRLIIGDRVNLSGRSCFYFVSTQREVTGLQGYKVTGLQSCSVAGGQNEEPGGYPTAHSPQPTDNRSQSTAHSPQSSTCHPVTLEPCHSFPTISIGSHTFIGHQCTFSAARQIAIGESCLISSGVRIHDNSGHPTDPSKRLAGEKVPDDDVAPVVIEPNVWIGAAAVIMRGVTIGRNSIVGASSVVTHDVPPDTIVVGNPAKVVKHLSNAGT